MKSLHILIFLMVFAPLVGCGQHDSVQHQKSVSELSESNLTEPGNDIFATVQEVIQQLGKRADTDWSTVNIPALRQHLLDMRDVAEHVEVKSRKPVDGGLQVTVKPTTSRAHSALTRVLDAHPKMLQKETGWQMKIEKADMNFVLTTTTDQPEEVDKIRALGYFGLIAYGTHHQRHHWMIATGQQAHGKTGDHSPHH